MSGGAEVTVSPRVERAHRLSDRLRKGQSVSGVEVANMITELADSYHHELAIRTLLAVRMLAQAERPYAEIVEMIDEALR